MGRIQQKEGSLLSVKDHILHLRNFFSRHFRLLSVFNVFISFRSIPTGNHGAYCRWLQVGMKIYYWFLERRSSGSYYRYIVSSCAPYGSENRFLEIYKDNNITRNVKALRVWSKLWTCTNSKIKGKKWERVIRATLQQRKLRFREKKKDAVNPWSLLSFFFSPIICYLNPQLKLDF